MRTGTIVSIGASAVLGIGALLIARLWIPSHPAHVAATAAPVVVQDVPVVVAAVPIPWGAKLDAKYLKVVKLPPGVTPEGAYSNLGQILNQDGGAPMALTPMATQEPVLASKLTGPGERQTLAALVGPGMRAYTIAVTASTAGGGHILPGDRIDVLYAREVPPPAMKTAPNFKLYATSVLIQNVRVLGVDLNANPTSTQPAIPSTATLEVTMQDAEKLALATQGGGTLSLALRRPGSVEIERARRFVIGDPHGGSPSDAGDNAPPSGEGPPPRSSRRPRNAEVASTGAQVTVVSGDAASDVSVPNESARSRF